MLKYCTVLLILVGSIATHEGWAQQNAPVLLVETYRNDADQIIDTALSDSSGFERLAYMCDTFGHRFSGSDNLERAIDWILETMAADSLDNVRGEQVMVPHWVRGRESLTLLEPRVLALPVLGLGGSIGTPPDGLTAEVLVVHSFDELEQRKEEARGKIVLFNAAFTTYGQTVRYRVNGAVRAAEAGAVASLVRSVAGGNPLWQPGKDGFDRENCNLWVLICGGDI